MNLEQNLELEEARAKHGDVAVLDAMHGLDDAVDEMFDFGMRLIQEKEALQQELLLITTDRDLWLQKQNALLEEINKELDELTITLNEIAEKRNASS